MLDAGTHMQTAAGRAALRKRKQFIQLVFADANVRNRLARAQRRGRDNMLNQALPTAATMNLRKLVQLQPRVGARAATVACIRPIQGAVRTVRCISDRVTSARSPLTALTCDLFLLRLRREFVPAFGVSLSYGT